MIDLFTRWRHALKIDSLDKLCDLMVVDQLRHSVSKRVSSYLGDRGVMSPLEAAALADDYLINHKGEFERQGKEYVRRDHDERYQSRSVQERGLGGKPGPDSICHYCAN